MKKVLILLLISLSYNTLNGFHLPKKTIFKFKDLPESYDARTAFPKCASIQEIRDQGNCNAAWAFAAVSAMSDRICISSNQSDQRRLSAKNLISCCTSCGSGCSGGYAAQAWKYWKDTGIVTGGPYGDTKTCQPYFLPKCNHFISGSYEDCSNDAETPKCANDCSEGNGFEYKNDLIKSSSAYTLQGEVYIMQEIYENGPVQASFTVYSDFLTYTSGIYAHSEGSALGAHDVKIIGWGVQDGVKFWLCANSWNEEWGDKGFFKIKRGNNECGIENAVNAGVYIPEDLSSIFKEGPYEVKITEVASGDNGAPRQFKIYEPSGITGRVPVVHFLHGFQLKYNYYDDLLTRLSSHGFIVISGQSEHKLIGGDTSYVEAEKVITFIEWLKENLSKYIIITPDFDNFGISGHSRGGKVTNRILNTYPNYAKSFFGVDPVDSAPPMSGSSDPPSLDEEVKFKGESMFVGTEKGPSGMQACAPSGDNSVHFFEKFPGISHHIIAANVGHMDMIDSGDKSSCGLVCSACAGSSDSSEKQKFINYVGGLMAAFFSSTLKGLAKYEAILNDSTKQPFATKLVEFK